MSFVQRSFFLAIAASGWVATMAQPITGRVTGTEAEVLPGANVYWAGTSVGTATDVHGDFTIPLSAVQSVLEKKVVLNPTHLGAAVLHAIHHAHDKEEAGL